MFHGTHFGFYYPYYPYSYGYSNGDPYRYRYRYASVYVADGTERDSEARRTPQPETERTPEEAGDRSFPDGVVIRRPLIVSEEAPEVLPTKHPGDASPLRDDDVPSGVKQDESEASKSKKPRSPSGAERRRV